MPRTARKPSQAHAAEEVDQPKTPAAFFPSIYRPLFTPARYKVYYSGRGAAKSWTFARALVARGAREPLRWLFAREYQNSIQESVHKLLSNQIADMGVGGYYDIAANSITGVNGTEFIFSGIRNNVTKIKSMEGLDGVWVEEGEKVSDDSWRILIPTLRKDGSEIWVSFNPDLLTDPTYQRFVLNPPPGAIVVKTSWRDNPWFPEELERERQYLLRVDPDAYAHVWEGECRSNSDAQVLRGKVSVEAFEPQPGWDGPYAGADWGFAVDPTAAVKLWIDGRRLLIEYEAYKVKLDIDRTAEEFDTIPGFRDMVVRADSARPETISYMQKHGYPRIIGVHKWSGSVEDGVAHLRQYEQIVIHPRCTHTIEEARLYSYKVDRLSGDVLPDIVDKHNHCIDAIRYALEPIIRGSGLGLLAFYTAEADAVRARQTEELERSRGSR